MTARWVRRKRQAPLRRLVVLVAVAGSGGEAERRSGALSSSDELRTIFVDDGFVYTLEMYKTAFANRGWLGNQTVMKVLCWTFSQRRPAAANIAASLHINYS